MLKVFSRCPLSVSGSTGSTARRCVFGKASGQSHLFGVKGDGDLTLRRMSTPLDASSGSTARTSPGNVYRVITPFGAASTSTGIVAGRDHSAGPSVSPKVPAFVAALHQAKEHDTRPLLHFPSVMPVDALTDAIADFAAVAPTLPLPKALRHALYGRPGEQGLMPIPVDTRTSRADFSWAPIARHLQRTLTANVIRATVVMSSAAAASAAAASGDSSSKIPRFSSTRAGMTPGFDEARFACFDPALQRDPLLPYQTSEALVLAHLPDPAVADYIRTHKLIRYVEHDAFAVPRLWMRDTQPAAAIAAKPDGRTRDVTFNTPPTPGAGSSTGMHRKEPRIPCVCVMGHIDHGKTTLLDTLQRSDIARTEPGRITQSIRAFTVTMHRHAYPRHVTFVDTPGHRIFSELRLHGGRVSDLSVLVVALDEGVLGQTEEVVQTALHFGKPIIVLLNKVDLFSDPEQLANRIVEVTAQLARLGLHVQLVDTARATAANEVSGVARPSSLEGQSADANMTAKSEEDLEAEALAELFGDKFAPPAAVAATTATAAPLPRLDAPADSAPAATAAAAAASFVGCNFVPSSLNARAQPSGADLLEYQPPLDKETLRFIDREYRPRLIELSTAAGAAAVSRQQLSTTPVNATQRALGLCMSGRSGANLAVFASVLREIFTGDAAPVSAVNATPRQAIILESRKDSAGGDARASQGQRRPAGAEAGGGTQAMSRSIAAATSGTGGRAQMLVIVRNGRLDVGMPFVADQSWGVISGIQDAWGVRLKRPAFPGEAVVVFGIRDPACPATGAHIIERATADVAMNTFKFRNSLRIFLERHPTKSYLLRPPGMNTKFFHVGNYGQAKADTAFDYNLLYKNAKSPEVRESETEMKWRANQLSKDQQPTTVQEYEAHVMKTRQLSLLLKVDTWNSARIAVREIPRLATKDVTLNVVGVSFGAITEQELMRFPRLDAVVAFRAPRLTCAHTGFRMQVVGTRYGEFDVYTDMIEWIKAWVVEVQQEETRKKGAATMRNGAVVVEGETAADADAHKRKSRQGRKDGSGSGPDPFAANVLQEAVGFGSLTKGRRGRQKLTSVPSTRDD